VRRHCHETLLLDRGVVLFQGESDEAVRLYLDATARPARLG